MTAAFAISHSAMGRSRPKLVYSKRQTTLLHPLEAPVGLIKYDAVGYHCCEEAGMFGSPISTVA